MGQWVADAYQHDEHRLPHTYPDPEKLFPRTKAADVVKEDENLEPDDLDKRGSAVGKAKTTKPTKAATTKTTTKKKKQRNRQVVRQRLRGAPTNSRRLLWTRLEERPPSRGP